ncbi:DUF3427 domain-containing protein [Streptomyces sp. SID8379]|uniref:DUF3427 domain-containing protein n=1 Tax=unclassified Streptomyces TaxID=2593676 RepID=UPI0004760195|nr:MULTISPECIES: DUF3427 domain-containing protein [unclassified Streptomyces]MYW66045.1 DUF3427 domain-containing protein [Streptomyces sp. SID8379]
MPRRLTPGLYEHIVTNELDQRTVEAAGEGRVQREPLDPEDAPEILGRYVGDLVRRTLRAHSKQRGSDGAAQRLVDQVAAINRIVEELGRLSPMQVGDEDAVALTRDLLLAVADRAPLPGEKVFPERPHVPLAASALFANRSRESVGHALQRELESADRVDLICAFIKWSGLRLLLGKLKDVRRRGKRLRVITTTYMGATDQRAVDALAELGAEVRISYETQATRLHAKAWHFHRESGTSTAYVGSSNMSKAALVDGLEWNVRLSQLESPTLVTSITDTFEDYWADPAFELYDPQSERDRNRLADALNTERSGPAQLPIELAPFDIQPHPHQREVLDELQAQRELHDRHRNLVVMATGTGKTVVSALDYRALRQAGKVDSLLFVAHRDSILKQSRAVFRHVLKDGAFGGLYVGGERPDEWRHVFASIQSLTSSGYKRLHPEHFDMVIVDEFHHAGARTYEELLTHIYPKELLGLTATPERTDQYDITRWFEGRTAVDLRLWEAVERGLLVPFHYFGINDETDLRSLRFSRRTGYQTRELEKLYTGDDARVRIILNELHEKVLDPRAMHALGFCVSVAHARYMAEKFTQAGLPSQALTGESSPREREQAVSDLVQGRIKALFTVDLFNEGVDIPCVDTVILLRPTESATVFLQQLGRGLRHAENKTSLTVLDFIGAQHADFRFEPSMRALTGATHRQVAREVEQGFPTLPSGCAVQLDRVARKYVLDSLQRTLKPRWAQSVAELRRLGDVSLGEFLKGTASEIEDVYRPSRGTWSELRDAAGMAVAPPGPADAELSKALRRSLHIDDPERLTYLRLLSGAKSPDGLQAGVRDWPTERLRRLAAMANSVLWGDALLASPVEAAAERILVEHRRKEELQQLVPELRERLQRVTRPLDPGGPNPLHVHAHYTRAEAEAAFGGEYKGQPTGVKWFEGEQADVFFIDLVKSEKHYSETTRYEDRVISPRRFQWETQSRTSITQETGQRYINHEARGSSLHLFVRESKKADGLLGAPSFIYVGPATYVTHENDRPMRLTLELEHTLPVDLYRRWSQLSG